MVIEIIPYLKLSMIEGWATAVRPSGSTIPASAHPTRRSIYGSGPGHDGSKGIQAVLQDVPQYLSAEARIYKKNGRMKPIRQQKPRKCILKQGEKNKKKHKKVGKKERTKTIAKDTKNCNKYVYVKILATVLYCSSCLASL